MVTLLNGDSVVQPQGSVVRLLNSQAFLSKSDDPSHLEGTIGVRYENTEVGVSGRIVLLTAGALVLMEVEPFVGDNVYLSASASGKGTNIPPGLAFILGRCVEKVFYEGSWYARVIPTALNNFPFASYTKSVSEIATGSPVYRQSNTIFAPAKADALATSKVLGIYTGGSEIIKSSGIVSNCLFDGVPSIGDCYLSGSLSALTSTPPNGLRVNTRVGEVIRINDSSHADVQLMLDWDRDLLKGFLIQDYVVPSQVSGGTGQIFPIAAIDPSLISAFSIECQETGNVASQVGYTVKKDGNAMGEDSEIYPNGTSPGSTMLIGGSTGASTCAYKTGAYSRIQMLFEKAYTGNWNYRCVSRTKYVSVLGERYHTGTFPTFTPANALSIVGSSATNSFVIGEHWHVRVWH